MNVIRRTIEIDAATDARLREIAASRGQDVAEDRRRLDEFTRTGLAIPFDEVKEWVVSWGGADELPRPAPRKIA